MIKLRLEVYNNKIETRDDIQKYLNDILTPLEEYFDNSDTILNNNNFSSGIPDLVSGFEGYSRILWGLSASNEYKKDHILWMKIRNGLKNGTDPSHEHYFGIVWDYDQRIVEMAAIAYALIYKPDCIYEPLDEQTKSNLYLWLNQAFYREAHHCNWKFFRVLVGVAFTKLGLSFDQSKMEDYLEDINSFYIGNGWYSDGSIGETHIDYYIPFAFHFYGLVYADNMMEVDPDRSKDFIERAKQFSSSYIYLFSQSGDAVPYGRSMVYRFAQISFWSMIAKLEIKTEFELGEIKGLILSHLRWWNSQYIFDSKGHLSQGYAYENHTFTEQYNGPTSMYWALKAFAFLMLPEDHIFWDISEKSLPLLKRKKLINESNMIVTKSENQSHTLMYTPGYKHTTVHTHSESKYEKLVYSNIFGFSVPKSNKNLQHGSFDNTLVISEDGTYYRHKEFTTEKKVTKNYVLSKWKPFSDVEITSIVIPFGVHHFRIHTIKSERHIQYADAGFSFPIHDLHDAYKENREARCCNENMYSYINGLSGNSTPEIIGAYNNTNLLHSRTRIPTLVGKLTPGVHELISFVSGDNNKWTKLVPRIAYKSDNELHFYLNDKFVGKYSKNI